MRQIHLCGAVFLGLTFATCSKREFQAGDNPECFWASCCNGGWFWNGQTCAHLVPPYCGCICEGPSPFSYQTLEACQAQHPAAAAQR